MRYEITRSSLPSVPNHLPLLKGKSCPHWAGSSVSQAFVNYGNDLSDKWHNCSFEKPILACNSSPFIQLPHPPPIVLEPLTRWLTSSTSLFVCGMSPSKFESGGPGSVFGVSRSMLGNLQQSARPASLFHKLHAGELSPLVGVMVREHRHR